MRELMAMSLLDSGFESYSPHNFAVINKILRELAFLAQSLLQFLYDWHAKADIEFFIERRTRAFKGDV